MEAPVPHPDEERGTRVSKDEGPAAGPRCFETAAEPVIGPRYAKKIQNALGSLNDFVAHRDMAVDAALKAPAPRGDGRARAFASGVVLGREDQAVKPLVKAAAREVRGLEVI